MVLLAARPDVDFRAAQVPISCNLVLSVWACVDDDSAATKDAGEMELPIQSAIAADGLVNSVGVTDDERARR